MIINRGWEELGRGYSALLLSVAALLVYIFIIHICVAKNNQDEEYREEHEQLCG